MPVLQTSLCTMLNIELPIIQAPMGGVASPALAAAVSNAGGLGMLPLTWHNLGAVRRAIRQTRQLTDRPFGVNLILQWPQQERLKACLEEGVSVVSFFWGDPSPYIAAVHAAGSLVMHTVGSAAEARQVRDAGVDILVAQGWEAGGHVWGQVATLALVPCVVDAVAPAPVVAAGGIADGRGLAAVLTLGAAGAWIGTRFIASQEADAHQVYKEKVLQAVETDTVYSRLFDGSWPDAPHRTLHNTTLTNWEASGSPPSGERPSEGEVIATRADGFPVMRYSASLPSEGMTGELEALALYAGQSAGLVSRLQSAHDIVKELADEAVRTLQQCVELLPKDNAS
ncbi:MAG: NAD(P)H-dependent flavin oxidoreductase [Ktedonobacteraceae bacterium]